MSNSAVRVVRFVSCSLFALTALGATGTAIAQPVPHSLVASPDIYKVIAEDDHYRVIEVTWAPGQRDHAHSHPASAVYYPMDCTLRGYGPTGAALGEATRKAGTAIVQKPIPSHSVQNVGPSACRLIMFEPK